MDISVVIPTRNKARYLERTLESLVQQQLPAGTFEIVVVNNGSSDETADVVDRYRRLYDCVRPTTLDRPGRSRARNAGIARATAAVVLFIDDDCLCPPDLLQQHLTRHRRSAGPCVVLGGLRQVFSILPPEDDLSEAIAASCALLDHSVQPDERTVAPVLRRCSLWDVWDVRHRFDAIAAASGVYPTTAASVAHLDLVERGESISPWLSFTSCHASVSRDLFSSLGSFDEDFKGWGEEDAELAYRLWKAGVPFHAVPSTPVYHQNHHRSRSDYIRNWFVNYVQATEKHPSTDWYLRWRLSLGYITPVEFEATMRDVTAGDTRRRAAIQRQHEFFVRVWPTTDYGRLLKSMTAGGKSIRAGS